MGLRKQSTACSRGWLCDERWAWLSPRALSITHKVCNVGEQQNNSRTPLPTEPLLLSRHRPRGRPEATQLGGSDLFGSQEGPGQKVSYKTSGLVNNG